MLNKQQKKRFYYFYLQKDVCKPAGGNFLSTAGGILTQLASGRKMLYLCLWPGGGLLRVRPPVLWLSGVFLQKQVVLSGKKHYFA